MKITKILLQTLALFGTAQAGKKIELDKLPDLHVAVLQHDFHKTNHLLSAGINPDTLGEGYAFDRGPLQGHAAPIHLAAYELDLKFTALLMRHGADPYQTTSTGKNFFDIVEGAKSAEQHKVNKVKSTTAHLTTELAKARQEKKALPKGKKRRAINARIKEIKQLLEEADTRITSSESNVELANEISRLVQEVYGKKPLHHETQQNEQFYFNGIIVSLMLALISAIGLFNNLIPPKQENSQNNKKTNKAGSAKQQSGKGKQGKRSTARQIKAHRSQSEHQPKKEISAATHREHRLTSTATALTTISAKEAHDFILVTYGRKKSGESTDQSTDTSSKSSEPESQTIQQAPPNTKTSGTAQTTRSFKMWQTPAKLQTTSIKNIQAEEVSKRLAEQAKLDPEQLGYQLKTMTLEGKAIKIYEHKDHSDIIQYDFMWLTIIHHAADAIIKNKPIPNFEMLHEDSMKVLHDKHKEYNARQATQQQPR